MRTAGRERDDNGGGNGSDEMIQASVKCRECGGNMESFTRVIGTNRTFNGHTCPPCTRTLKAADRLMRNELENGAALIVFDDSRRGLFRLDSKDPKFSSTSERLIGPPDDVATKRHTAHAKNGTTPLYTLKYVAEWDEEKQMIPNNRAERIAMEMNIFDLDADKPILGPVMFLGPDELPLTEEEMEKFSTLVQ